LSAGAAALPGLAERFAEFKDSEVLACVPGCSALAAAEHAKSWDVSQDSATLYRTARLLPPEVAARLAPVRIQNAQSTSRRRAATHVLYKGKALVLRPEPIIAGVGAGEGRLQVTDASAGISPLHCSLFSQAGEAE